MFRLFPFLVDMDHLYSLLSYLRNICLKLGNNGNQGNNQGVCQNA